MSTKYLIRALILGLFLASSLTACVMEEPTEGSAEAALLAAPTSVTATATSSSRITVSWSAVAGASVYYVYRSDSGGPYTAIAATNAPVTTFDAAGLAPSTSYGFWITAYDPSDGTESSPSPTATATTFDASGGLAAPTGVTATPISSSRIQVSWTAVPTATLYYIYRSDAGGPFNAIAATSSTTFESAGLVTSTNYCYVIQAYNAAGSSPLSSPACATTFNDQGNLTAPTNVQAIPVSSSRIQVTWSPVATATAYYIYQSASGGPFTAVAAVTSTSYDATGLSASTNYCYQVQAYNGAFSPMSASACTVTSAAGLEGRWKFDERTGSTAFDSSGFTRTGTLQGGTSFNTTDVAPLIDETGHNRSSLSSPGGASDFVNVPDANAFSFSTGAFTVSAWVKTSGTTHIAGKRAAGCGAANWDFGTTGSTVSLQGTNTVSGGSVPANTWTQIAASFSGGTATLFVNGSQVASGAWTPGTSIDGPLNLGNISGCTGSSALVDEVRIYSSVLSASELAVLGTRPPAPTNLTAMVISTTRVDLTWTAVAGADQYLVYRGSAAGNETYLTSMSAASPTYIEGHLTPGQTTSWQVRAVIDGLISDFSNEVVVTSLSAPPAPTGVTATATSSSQIQVSWNAESTAQVYYIYMSVGGGAYTGVGAVLAPTTSFTAGGLSPNTAYSFVVASYDSGGTTGPQSSPASATTLP